MAYPQNSRGLDPRMQRIIEAAGAGEDDEPFPNTPFSLLSGPAAQAPPAFSHHSSNRSSLQDMFIHQASPPAASSLARSSMQQGEAHEAGYQPGLYSMPRQPLQTSFYARTAKQNSAGPPKLSLTPRSIHAPSDTSFYDSGASSSLGARPNDFGRESTLANLRTQPKPLTYGQPSSRQSVVNTSFHVGGSRYRAPQPQLQQPSPPIHLIGSVFTPPPQRSSSPDLTFSSPTKRVVANRENRLTFPSSQQAKETTALQISGRLSYRGPILHEEESKANPVVYVVPPVVNGIKLISTRDLPDRFRTVFPFPLFNAIQSKVFPSVFGTNDNVIISAPTGGGKTAILELAIVKLIETHSSGQFKIVYQAPTKSLCSERARDWAAKFGPMNFKTAELTGDTDATELRKVWDATIIVTTPEKWDSITRKWKDHVKLLQLVKLFLIDEVHILKEDRGSTLEAVVSRMKSIGASVRFVALSATVPNSHDIALWLGRDHRNCHLPAHRETFGEEFRPVKLQKHVHGFESSGNDYAFDSILTGKLPGLIERYSHKKPMMVFCFTRKSCETTAAKLAEWWASLRPTDKAWPTPTERVSVSTKELNDLVTKGVAYHHAGLDPADRTAIEKGYLNGQLNVICCTSTLAVGVNLPCHLVILKGTVGYQNGQLAEYSDLEVMQMLGRAGRPQFDDSAVAIIMTSKPNVDRYANMSSGQDVLESTLHLNLIEHLNSEIGLGTVRDLNSAKAWLGGTFLSVRMKDNPKYYNFNCDTDSRDPGERLELVCERDIKLLQNAKLITSESRFACTKYGESMSKYMVKFETMVLLLSIPEHATMPQIMEAVCQATEFKDLKMKANERAYFRELNKSTFIKWPIKETVTSLAHKISLIIQAQLGGVDLPNKKDFNRRQYMTEQALVFDRIQRLVRCVVDCKAHDADAIATQNALELSRSISAQYWEHLPNQLRQISGIGPAAVRKLVAAGVSSVDNLMAIDSATLERIMSRNPPYGHKVLESLKDFPRLTLKADVVGKIVKRGQSPRLKIRALLSTKNSKVPYWDRQMVSLTFMAAISSGSLAHFWRGTMKKLEKGFEFYFFAELLSPSDAVSCFLACDNLVGTAKTVILSHDLPTSAFPSHKIAESYTARPAHSIESDGEFDYDDGFDWDGITAKDLEDGIVTARIEAASKNKESNNENEFLDLDEVLAKPFQNVAKTASNQDQPVPAQMANGKWMCNHICRDGQKTKHGTICKHKCCHEGLEKPRKIQPPRKPKMTDVSRGQDKVKEKAAAAEPELWQPKLKKTSHSGTSFTDLRRIEVLDLSHVPDSIPAVNIPQRGSQKHQTLHSRFSAGDPVPTIRKVKPTANYGSGAQPFQVFLQSGIQRRAQRFPLDLGAAEAKYERPSKHSVSPKSGWISYHDEDDDDELQLSHDAREAQDPFVTNIETSPRYSSFTAELLADDSYLAFSDDALKSYYDNQEDDTRPATATSFAHTLADYDASSTTEPLKSNSMLSDISNQSHGASSKRKTPSPDTNDYSAGMKKPRLSADRNSEPGRNKEQSPQQESHHSGTVAQHAILPQSLADVVRDGKPAPRPVWLQALANQSKWNADFIAYLEGPLISWESDEDAQSALKMQQNSD